MTLQKTIKKNNSFLKVDQLDFTNTKFNYTDLNSLKKPIQVDSLNIYAQNLNFYSDTLTLTLNNLKGVLKTPFQEQIETTAMLTYMPGSLKLENWKLISSNNKIEGALKLLGQNNSFRDFNNKGKFEPTNFNFTKFWQFSIMLITAMFDVRVNSRSSSFS